MEAIYAQTCASSSRGGSDDSLVAKEKARADGADYADAELLHSFHSLPTTRSTTCSSGEAKGRASVVDVVLVTARADPVILEAKMANLSNATIATAQTI